ncbi:MAG TPA: pitrilysin family protein [Thermomicrobiales bacterium]|nr:pitrilysin family protein [Thermomicrobiales bacterium]
MADPLYEKSTLDNGVRVVTGPMKGVKSASLILYYGVGSRFEDPTYQGVSHFLEHMLFKGTERRPDPLIISQAIESVGGILNAATGRESTNYWAKVPSTHFPLAFDVISDIVRNSVIDETELNKERSVIVEEIRSILDAPEDLVHDVIDETIWGTQSVGRPVAGTEDTVGAIDQGTMASYWKRNYRPERLVVAAGGDVTHEEVVKLAEQHLGGLAPEGEANVPEPSNFAQEDVRINLVERDTEQAHLCIGMPALPYSTERRYVQGTIEAILSSGMSSRLFQEIREKRGLVYSVYGYFRPYEDVGQGVVYAGTDLERVEEAISAIIGELRKLRDEGVPEDELERTKDLRKGRLLMGFEDSRSIASWIGSQELTYGEIRTPEEVMEKIDAVTSAEVKELADELFQTNKLSLALIGPYSDEQAFRSIMQF